MLGETAGQDGGDADHEGEDTGDDAVREGAGDDAEARIAGMKKKLMAANAAELLDGTGWLPRSLRVPGEALHEAVPLAAE